MSDEFVCPICLNVMFEPVTLPCSHDLCKACLESTLNEAAMLCPICRYRLSIWVRRNRKKGNLVNQEKWRKIKELFPNYVTQKMSGNISVELTDEEQKLLQSSPMRGHVPRPLAAPGELKREYEAELARVRDAEALEERDSLALVRQLEMEEAELRSVRQSIFDRDAEMAAELQQQQQLGDSREPLPTSTPAPKRARLEPKRQSGATPSWLDRFMSEKRRLSGQLTSGRSSSVDSIGPELRPPPFRPIETFPRSPTKPAPEQREEDEWPLLRPRVQPSEASKENVCSPVATRARRALQAASARAKTARSLRRRARQRTKRRALATSATTAFSPVGGQRPDRSILEFARPAPKGASRAAEEEEEEDCRLARELQRRFDLEYRYSLTSLRLPGEDYCFRERPPKQT